MSNPNLKLKILKQTFEEVEIKWSNVSSLSKSQTDISCMCTYRIQSTIMSSEMSSVGSPADSNTITMDTMPACGMPAAPVLAAVTIKLNRRNSDGYVMLVLFVHKKTATTQ